MKKKPIAKIVSLLLCLALLVTVFSGCDEGNQLTAATTVKPNSAKILITDMKGREMTLRSAAKKIVALTAGDCEILYALESGDTLVGRGEYCDYPEAVSSVTAVTSGSETNIEEIIALKPDVVLMGTMAQTLDHVASLEKAGIVVVATEATDIEGVYTAIRLIGKILDKNALAAELINSMRNEFNSLKAKADGKKEKTIYFETSPLQYGLWSAGSKTFMNDIAELLGLKNIFADQEGWPQVSQEQVIAKNPDYIVTTAMYFGEGQRPEAEIKGRKGWENISAIKSNGVVSIDVNEISRPGPRLVNAAKALYEAVYGTQG